MRVIIRAYGVSKVYTRFGTVVCAMPWRYKNHLRLEGIDLTNMAAAVDTT